MMFKNFWNSFQIICVSSFILSGSFFIQHDVVLAGDFLAKCQILTGSQKPLSPGHSTLPDEGHFMSVVCKNKVGDNIQTKMDLDAGIGNTDGFLVFKGAGFSRSCHHSNIIQDSEDRVALASWCTTKQPGREERSVINLNDRISYQDGHPVFDQ